MLSRRSVILILISVLIYSTAAMALIYYLPRYLLELGFDRPVVQIVTTIYPFTSIFMPQILGKFSDKIQNRYIFIVLGAFEATVVLETGVALAVVMSQVIRKKDISPPADIKYAATSGGLIFFGSVLYSYSVGAIGAALTSAINAGVPIVNSVASYFLLGEKLDAHKYAAIVLMVLGLIAIFI